MAVCTTSGGVRIWYRDWGDGPPVVFSHGWPLTADAWDPQVRFLASNGFRCIAHDRRGHGRSDQPWDGNHMDQYADDLAELIAGLDLREVTLIGHSTGGGEVVRYLGRHGTDRVARVVLVSAVPPILISTKTWPNGLPRAVFDDLRAKLLADRPQFYRDFSGPFFGANRPNSRASQGMRDHFWFQCMMGGLEGQYTCITAFSETDFTADLDRIDVPTLLIHGDDDQIVPIAHSSQLAVKRIRGAQLKVYPGGPHALAQIHTDELNADLLAFARGSALAPA